MEAKIAQSEFSKQAEFNRYGLISMIILIVGCLGGGAVGCGAINHVSTLILVIVPTMLSLSLILAVAPMKWIINVSIVSVLIDLLLIIYFLFIA